MCLQAYIKFSSNVHWHLYPSIITTSTCASNTNRKDSEPETPFVKCFQQKKHDIAPLRSTRTPSYLKRKSARYLSYIISRPSSLRCLGQNICLRCHSSKCSFNYVTGENSYHQSRSIGHPEQGRTFDPNIPLLVQ